MVGGVDDMVEEDGEVGGIFGVFFDRFLFVLVSLLVDLRLWFNTVMFWTFSLRRAVLVSSATVRLAALRSWRETGVTILYSAISPQIYPYLAELELDKVSSSMA